MDRELKTTLSNILSHICCAADYGYNKSILMSDFADITGWVTDEEIKNYIDRDYSDYEEEDQEEILCRITDWRDDYCKPL